MRRPYQTNILSILGFGAALLVAATGLPPIAQARTSASDIPATFVPPAIERDYRRRTYEIPMRDGVLLHTVVIVPKGLTSAPMLLDRTPYGADAMTTQQDGPKLGDILFPSYADLARHGYIIVVQDVRGKFASGGDYIVNRPLRGPLNPTQTDHSTDAWDTIDWLVRHISETNGRVATIGGSYDGFTALMSLVDPHPALRASVPMNPMVNTWKGDDWFHNGAFRQEMLSYIYNQTADKHSAVRWPVTARDDYDADLRYGSAGALAGAMGMEQLAFWNRLAAHPDYDAYWQGQALDRILARKRLTVPTMLVDGLWDQEDNYGAPAVYQAVKAEAREVHLVLGPWYHGQQNGSGARLGPLDWGQRTGEWFRAHVLIPFLDEHLKDGAPPADIARVVAFASGDNRWENLPDWPVAGGGSLPLYLDTGGRLSIDGQEVSSGYDEYVSDPAKPVPYRPQPDLSIYGPDSSWDTWLVDDQRFAASRPDVLTYTSPVLTAPEHIAGQPVAHLYASTSGSDADWVVKLIDVYPDAMPEQPAMGGYQLPISMNILRGRYRNDPARPQPITPGRVERYDIVLPDANHVFLPGHRIMVQIQSSWFPLYDRNPQSYVANVFRAAPEDYVKATQRLFHAPDARSAVLLPLAAGS
ncbi:MAG: glutaryl-7-ACA acylase [Novosphingobium pentaromativorans]|uniref:Glutaryl-7-ACA acylase n=1 Tax=Novosphingobium pentaromativorans TaxID=205844 RepID=A0A2W5Q9X3_9SPHN|nr:CocE/NonD family hydrolase [Novosphingobium panipatense]PZQ54267.1 MAG: glutaryl-7-ACA acylase [Novosphingobium pentaromativorans]